MMIFHSQIFSHGNLVSKSSPWSWMTKRHPPFFDNSPDIMYGVRYVYTHTASTDNVLFSKHTLTTTTVSIGNSVIFNWPHVTREILQSIHTVTAEALTRTAP